MESSWMDAMFAPASQSQAWCSFVLPSASNQAFRHLQIQLAEQAGSALSMVPAQHS